MGTFFTNKRLNKKGNNVAQNELSEQTNEMQSKQANRKKKNLAVNLIVKIEHAIKQRSQHKSTNQKNLKSVGPAKRMLELIRRDFSMLEKVLNNTYQEIHKLDRSFRTKMISYIRNDRKRMATKIRAFKTTLIPHKSNFTNQIEIAPRAKNEMENILPITKIKMKQRNEEQTKLGLRKNLFKQFFNRLLYSNSQKMRNQDLNKIVVEKIQQEKYEEKQVLLTMEQILARSSNRNDMPKQLFSRSIQPFENTKEERLAQISEKIQNAMNFSTSRNQLGAAHAEHQL